MDRLCFFAASIQGDDAESHQAEARGGFVQGDSGQAHAVSGGGLA